MNVVVIIPTYQRPEKLRRCLQSILNQTYQHFEVHVFFDNDDTASATQVFDLLAKQDHIKTWFNTKHEYVIGSWNRFTKERFTDPSWNIMMWCVDDVELYPDCLEQAIGTMQQHYPDLDGVVGLAQECPGHPEYTYKQYGQVLLGKKFIARYQDVNYAVCCPAYQHFFQDEEMWRLANSLNKFTFCAEAKLKHYHPGFIPSERDATHQIVRGEIFERDRRIFAERQVKGLVWGKTWEL